MSSNIYVFGAKDDKISLDIKDSDKVTHVVSEHVIDNTVKNDEVEEQGKVDLFHE